MPGILIPREKVPVLSLAAKRCVCLYMNLASPPGGYTRVCRLLNWAPRSRDDALIIWKYTRNVCCRFSFLKEIFSYKSLFLLRSWRRRWWCNSLFVVCAVAIDRAEQSVAAAASNKRRHRALNNLSAGVKLFFVFLLPHFLLFLLFSFF